MARTAGLTQLFSTWSVILPTGVFTGQQEGAKRKANSTQGLLITGPENIQCYFCRFLLVRAMVRSAEIHGPGNRLRPLMAGVPKSHGKEYRDRKTTDWTHKSLTTI